MNDSEQRAIDGAQFVKDVREAVELQMGDELDFYIFNFQWHFEKGYTIESCTNKIVQYLEETK